jgi:hypothetical protein
MTVDGSCGFFSPFLAQLADAVQALAHEMVKLFDTPLDPARIRIAAIKICDNGSVVCLSRLRVMPKHFGSLA